ncbi:MAG: glycosyltransferase family 39 protein [Acidobacteria bacterium]|nr:glycosyltransferase family 39 protein [Acidobacteriota bacterium]
MDSANKLGLYPSKNTKEADPQGPIVSLQESELHLRIPLSGAGRLVILFGIAFLAVFLTRWPLQPAHLYSFDSVNLALALEEFDPTRNQPQPPGYPLFVVEARLLYPLFGTPERTFAVLRTFISGLSLALLFLLVRRMFSSWIGLIAAALFLVNPAFWYSGLTSPLRPHLALFSILVAYCFWRAVQGEPRLFQVGSITLGLAGGFRPELSLILLPLWGWSGWRCGRLRLLLRGALWIVLMTVIWVGILVEACGGLAQMLQAFQEYLNVQTFQTSALLEGASPGWRRMAGRAIVWTGLGALPWIWTLPFGWLKRQQWSDWKECLLFLSLWFLPAFLFNAVIHIGDPDHALTAIPVVCLVGGLCLNAAEKTIRTSWIYRLQEQGFVIWLLILSLVFVLTLLNLLEQRNFVVSVGVLVSLLFLFSFRVSHGVRPLISMALLGNVLLFFGEFPFPQGPQGGQFRGLASARDAFLGGRFESSYERAEWVNQMTEIAVEQIPRLKLNSNRPLVLIWSRDGVPVWRKLAYYFPSEWVYALDEKGDPGVPVSQARLWSGNKILATYSGETPIRLPIPEGARLVWFVAGGKVSDLGEIVPVKKMATILYSDLPAGTAGFRWGSFEFVPE